MSGDHQGHGNRKRGLERYATLQTAKSLHAFAIFTPPSLSFDLMTRHDVSHHKNGPLRTDAQLSSNPTLLFSSSD